MRKAIISVQHIAHTVTLLTNKNGDTFTSSSEELGDFLNGAANADEYAKERAIEFLEQVVADGWRQTNSVDKWHNVLDHRIPAEHIKTTAELYDIFNNETE